MLDIGLLYEFDLGMAKDYTKAMLWFRKGAAAGSGRAMNNIGYLYENGLGVSRDYTKAMLWYRKGAAAGSGLAMYNTGALYVSVLSTPSGGNFQGV